MRGGGGQGFYPSFRIDQFGPVRVWLLLPLSLSLSLSLSFLHLSLFSLNTLSLSLSSLYTPLNDVTANSDENFGELISSRTCNLICNKSAHIIITTVHAMSLKDRV